MNNNFLPMALFISLTAHTLFLCSSYWMKTHEPEVKKNQKKGVEISYQPRKKQTDIQQTPIKPAQQLDLKSDSSLSGNGSIPVKLVKEDQSLPKNFTMYE